MPARPARSALFACLLAIAAIASARADVAALAFRDLSGKSYTAADIASRKATVFFFISMQCPVSNAYSPRIVDLAREYHARAAFFAVDSNSEDTAAGFRADCKKRGYAFPAVKDTGTALADRLGARCTPEAVVLDSAGEVRYRGRIDDSTEREHVVRHFVRDALVSVLTGQAVATPRTLAAGCAIFRGPASATVVAAPSAGQVTYARDVAPILNRSCVPCHRAGEVAPFPLQTYAEARTWAAQIRDYTNRRIMPPWKAEQGNDVFYDARLLSDREIGTLSAWAACGSRQGAGPAPAAAALPDQGAWSLGKPDMVLQASRPYHLGAEGKDVYRNFVMPADFSRDTYLSAMEFQPGNRAIVHHVVCYIDPTGASAKMDGKDAEPGYTVPGVGPGIPNAQWGEVWVPGRTPRFLPPGVAIFIPKGAKLVMQVHYHRNGAPQTDRSRMALYLASGMVDHKMVVAPVANYVFRLQPGNSHQEVTGSLTLPIGVHIYSIFPHMHLLGKTMTVIATLPNGTTRTLISVRDWDFNWQETYEYRTPMALPRGTRLDMKAVYDNSEGNPHQLLHPPHTVTFGEQTTDEMCFAFAGFTLDREHLGVTASR